MAGMSTGDKERKLGIVAVERKVVDINNGGLRKRDLVVTATDKSATLQRILLAPCGLND